jgi:hypothetical protein
MNAGISNSFFSSFAQQLTRLITGAAAQQKLLKYYITDFIVRVRRVGRTKKNPLTR